MNNSRKKSKYSKKICEMCKMEYQPTAGRQRFCGSRFVPGTCSAKHNKNWYKRNPAPSRIEDQKKFFPVDMFPVLVRTEQVYKKDGFMKGFWTATAIFLVLIIALIQASK